MNKDKTINQIIKLYQSADSMTRLNILRYFLALSDQQTLETLMTYEVNVI